MTAHPPTAHPLQSTQPPSASTPSLPVDEADDTSGAGGLTGSGTGGRIIDRIERADIVRIAVVGLAALGAWAAGTARAPGRLVPWDGQANEKKSHSLTGFFQRLCGKHPLAAVTGFLGEQFRG